MNIRAGDRRHPETLPYRCCLSTLAGFGRLCRAGPARTLARIPDVEGHVNQAVMVWDYNLRRDQVMVLCIWIG